MTSSSQKFQYMSQLNSLQNVYYQIVIFWKLTEWCRFVTYLLNDPRTETTTLCPKKVIHQTHGDNFVNS